MNSILARRLVVGVSQVTMACDLERSRQAALELCILCELYRRKHGDYPETLNALVPEFVTEVPRDWLGHRRQKRCCLLLGRRKSRQSIPMIPLSFGLA